MPEYKLSAEQKLALQEAIDRHLGKYFKQFGLPSIAAILGTFLYVNYNATTWIDEQAVSAKEQVLQIAKSEVDAYLTERESDFAQLDTRTQRATAAADEVKGTADGLRGRLSEIEPRITGLNDDVSVLVGKLEEATTQLSDAQRKLAALGDDGAVKNAARLVEVVRDNDSLKEIASALTDRIVAADGEPWRIVAGSTLPGQGWVQYSNTKNAQIFVDISKAQFTSMPMILTSLGGKNAHWITVGATSIYPTDEANKAFRVVIQPNYEEYDMPGRGREEFDMLKAARENDWCINWIALGPVN